MACEIDPAELKVALDRLGYIVPKGGSVENIAKGLEAYTPPTVAEIIEAIQAGEVELTTQNRDECIKD